tara:strand:- start:72 stop:263 length:192 start_codon:yes stop_codon:yes gene_type:complete
MSPEEEQIDQLNDELRRIIHRFQLEFDLSIETIIGILEFVKQDLLSYGQAVEFEIDFDPEDEV